MCFTYFVFDVFYSACVFYKFKFTSAVKTRGCVDCMEFQRREHFPKFSPRICVQLFFVFDGLADVDRIRGHAVSNENRCSRVKKKLRSIYQ